MAPLGHHIRIRLMDNRVIATTPDQQRIVTRIVLEQGRRNDLLCTSLAGTHLHLDALCDAAAASHLVQRISSSAKQRLSLPQRFTHYPHEPIRDNRHLWHSVRYIFRQQRHHRLPPEQSIDGTNLPDLLGLRLVGAYTRDNLRKWLPQLRRSQLIKWLGVDELRMSEHAPMEDLLDATLLAAGLTELRGASRPVIAARCALVQVAGDNLNSTALARALGIHPRTLFRLRRRVADPHLVRAIRLSLGAKEDLRARTREWDQDKSA